MIRPWQKFVYGSLELPIAGIEVLLRFYLIVHFTDVVGLSLELCLVALLLSLIWGVLFEPWIGHRSDQFLEGGQNRWPWVLTGCLAAGGILLALFSVPAQWATSAKMFALLGGLIVLNSAWALAAVPYSALVGDVVGNSRDQSILMGWRQAFGQLGGLFSIGLAGFLIGQEKSPNLNSMAWILVIALYLLGFLASLSRSGFRPKEKADEEEHTPKDLPEHGPLRPLLLVLFAGFLLQITVATQAGLGLPYYRQSLGLDELTVQNLLLLFFGAGLISIPFWLTLCHLWSPVRALVAGLVLFNSVQVLPYFFPSNMGFIECLPLVVGAGWGLGCMVIFERLITTLGPPRKGLGLGFCFGLWRMLGKLGRALAVLLTSFWLDWAGLNAFDPRVGDRLSLAFGPGVVAASLIALVLILIFRREIERALLQPLP